MGTTLRGRVHAESRERGLAALEEVRRVVGHVDDLLSTWREDTELSRLNRAPAGVPTVVSPELVALLVEARGWFADTGGAFDPVVGALVDAWDLRGEGRRPDPAALEAARRASGFGVVALDPESGTVCRLADPARVDAGGFGKGVALRRAARRLHSLGVEEALLDFGGQILAVGGPDGGWRVTVAHPARRHDPAAALRVSDRSVATSGGSERFVRVGGRTLSHIVDPRTGVPVSPWGSVTVVAEDPVAADALSTALFVMGPAEALRWAAGRDAYGVLVLTDGPDGLEARWNRALAPYLVEAPLQGRTESDSSDFRMMEEAR